MSHELIEKVLKERGNNYGSFKNNAIFCQNLKLLFRNHVGWGNLSSSQRECIDMVCHKLARIINGDPNFLDSWVDINGYVSLVIKEIQAETNVKSNS